MGADHPIAWAHEMGKGRAWYTGGGHTSQAYAEPLFRAHLLGGILYAAGYARPRVASALGHGSQPARDAWTSAPPAAYAAPAASACA